MNATDEFYIAGLDDVPQIDIQAARSWRYEPPHRPKPRELLIAALISIAASALLITTIIVCII